MKKVAVVVGSKSDMTVMENCVKTLEEFGVSYDLKVLSAHRTIDEVISFSESAEEKYEVIIAAAGYAAHLGGVIAAKTILPVIGVPLDASCLNGIDSLLSTVQMPSGIPVATVTIGKSGAKNAALLAVEMMAIKYPQLKEKLKNYRENLRKKVLED